MAVLTNEVAASAAARIAMGIAHEVIPDVPAPRQTAAAGATVPENGVLKGFGAKLSAILNGLETRKIERKLFTSDTNAYFDADTLKDFSATLGAYGPVTGAVLNSTALRGGMTFAAYTVSFAHGPSVRVTLYLQPDGEIEQLLVTGKA